MAIKELRVAVGTGEDVTRADTITNGDFSLTFDRDVLHGETEDGVIFVHANGAEIDDHTPDEATVDSGLTQRFSMNLAPFFSTAGQGVDARVTGYSAGKVTALPVRPNPGDSVTLEKSGAYIGGGETSAKIRRGVATAWQAFQFTNAVPAPGSISGPIGWYSLKEAVSYGVDIDAKVAALPSLSMTGVDYPPVSDVVTRIDRYWGLAPMTCNDVSGTGYEAWVPQAIMTDLQSSNYGEYLGILIGAAACHLIGDVATTGQKRTLLVRLIAIGKEVIESGRITGIVIGSPATGGGLGGHNQWEWIPMLCYLWARDLEDDLDNLRTLMPTNILGQSFYWTSDQVAQLAPHDDPAKIAISRRRTITAVSGTLITYETYATDIARMDTRQLIMVRESDGATASITNVTNTLTGADVGYQQQVTINTQPGSPFTVGNEIYLQSPYTITAGEVDWRIGQQDVLINPSPAQDYRDQQMWLDEILFPHALGIWRSDWDAAKDYVLRCLAATSPAGHLFPQPWGERSLYYQGGNEHQFDKSMWDAHAASYGLA